MEKKIRFIKENYNVSSIYSIAPIVLKKEKVYLFFGKKQEVAYSLYTDGNIEHLATWTDKRPYNRDPFLEKCHLEFGQWINRFEFQITEANILLVEKKYQGNVVCNLYINEDNTHKVLNDPLYQVSINANEHLMIKKIGER